MPGVPRNIGDLIAIMAALRTPETGCPWDLAQDFGSIAPYTIEEAAEVAEAIARSDMTDLRDELGDLLLQVVYHSRMAEEVGAFSFGDVVAGICAKMIRRHPHVFGSELERAAGAAPGFWERIKAEERAEKAAERATLGGLPVPPARLLDGVPPALPALVRAVKLQDKAAAVGFDWPSLAPVFDKMREELAELETVALTAVGSHATGPRDVAAITEEFGDLMFVMANVARHLGIDPERALREANQKFQRRFSAVEVKLSERGKTPDASTLAEMDRLWDEAKRDERCATPKRATE